MLVLLYKMYNAIAVKTGLNYHFVLIYLDENTNFTTNNMCCIFINKVLDVKPLVPLLHEVCQYLNQ